MKRLALLCALASGLLLGQDQNWRTTVSLEITATDELKQKFSSYLSRELRSLGDITVKEKGGVLTLYITAMRVSNKSNQPTGLVIWVQMIRPLDFSLVELLLKTEVTTSTIGALRNWLEGYELIEYGSLYAGDEVRERCTKIVNDIDAKVFQPMRKSYQNIQSSIEAAKKKEQQK
jgi:hypothetical protein